MTAMHNGQQYRVIYTADGDMWARDVIAAAKGTNNEVTNGKLCSQKTNRKKQRRHDPHMDPRRIDVRPQERNGATQPAD